LTLKQHYTRKPHTADTDTHTSLHFMFLNNSLVASVRTEVLY